MATNSLATTAPYLLDGGGWGMLAEKNYWGVLPELGALGAAQRGRGSFPNKEMSPVSASSAFDSRVPSRNGRYGMLVRWIGPVALENHNLKHVSEPIEASHFLFVFSGFSLL